MCFLWLASCLRKKIRQDVNQGSRCDFLEKHSWGWLLYVLVAKIHSSVFNLASLHHPHPCLISNGHHCGWLWYWNRKKEKPWEYMLAPQQSGEVVSNAIHYRRSTPFHIQVISARCIVSKTLIICTSVAIILVIWVSGRTDIMSILIIQNLENTILARDYLNCIKLKLYSVWKFQYMKTKIGWYFKKPDSV